MILCSEPLSGRFQLVKISNDVDDEEFATLTGAHTHIAVVHYGYLFKLIRVFISVYRHASAEFVFRQWRHNVATS